MILRFMHAVIVAACCLFISFSPAGISAAKKNLNSKSVTGINKPNFAFPESVADDAAREMDKALSSGEYALALRCAMQLTIADNSRTKDNFSKGTALFDSLANVLPAPYSALAALLEARLFSDLYNSSRWTFDRRTLPNDSLPQDPQLWDANAFRSKVRALVERALTSSGDASGLPINRISGILTPLPDAAEGFSVEDFILLQGADMLSIFSDTASGSSGRIIPFFSGTAVDSVGLQPSQASSESDLTPAALYRRMIGLHSAAPVGAMVLPIIALAETMPVKEGRAYLESWISRLEKYPFVLVLADAYCDSYPPTLFSRESKQLYVRLERLAASHRRSRYHGLLMNDLASMRAGAASINTASRALPGKDIQVRVRVDNIPGMHILVYRLPKGFHEDYEKIAKVLSSGTLVSKIPVVFPADSTSAYPYSCSDTVTVKGLTPGFYAFLASATPTPAGIYHRGNRSYSVELVNVGDLALTGISSGSEDGKSLCGVYTVDAATQHPLGGVSVKYSRRLDPNRKETRSVVSDANGFAAAPFDDKSYWDVVAQSGDSYASGNFNRRVWRPDTTVNVRGQVFTDLSIYRPGNTVRFSAVVFSRLLNEFNLKRDMAVEAYLYDANGERRDSIALDTDPWGRISGEFTLPASGLLGTWYIGVSTPEAGKNGYGQELGRGSFEVADYKAPAFMVTLGRDEKGASADAVKFSGVARTYSGMPVQDAEVKFDVRFDPWGFWFRSVSAEPATYGSTLRTDSEGRFEITLPTADLRNSDYRFGTFSLSASVTDAAGESVEAPSLDFFLSEAWRINASIPDCISLADTAALKTSVRVTDPVGTPVSRLVNFSIDDEKGMVKSGTFMSPLFDLASLGLKPGKYEVRFSVSEPGGCGENTSEAVSCAFVLYDPASAEIPFTTQLWCPDRSVTAAGGAATASVVIGSSYPDDWLLVTVSDSRGSSSAEWVRTHGEALLYKVAAPEAGERSWVKIASLHNLYAKTASVEVLPSEAAHKLEIGTVTFRDRLDPGATEHWKFRFSIPGAPTPQVTAMAVMSDKALDALAPFNWYFNPLSMRSWHNPLSLSIFSPRSVDQYVSLPRDHNYKENPIVVPDWQLYGLSLLGRRSWRYGNSIMSKYVVNESYDTCEAVMEECAEAPMTRSMKMMATSAYAAERKSALTGAVAMEDGSDSGAGKEVTPPLRDSECPSALFIPSLVADAQGIVSVDFDLPDFNTEWKFQILGYTGSLMTAHQILTAVAARKVMARSSFPAFLRTGDKASLSATLFNNADAPLAIGGRIEVFDPVTEVVLADYDFKPEEIHPSGSRVITARFDVPADISALGLRVWAKSGSGSDGEQTVIPVLPASQPVVESTPFYLDPAQRELSLKLPGYDKGAQVSLDYCGNPVWFCLTALPDIMQPQSNSSVALSSAIYANALSHGILAMSPSIRRGFEAIMASDQDSMLVSNLEKNEAFRTVLLDNTPWVRNARSETLRMSRLGELLDSAAYDRVQADLWRRLLALRNADGGFSWLPDSKSSLYITSKVLAEMGRLRAIDAALLPARAKGIIPAALAYCDAAALKVYKENKRQISLTDAVDWLYIRSFFPEAVTTKADADFHKAALDKITDGWSALDIFNKATAAIILHRAGRDRDAKLIMRSIGEFANSTPGRGCWFEIPRDSWSWYTWPPLVVTARVLEAYRQIEPYNPLVDGLRQWLVMQRQSQDWGATYSVAEVTYSLLANGTDWTASTSLTPPEVLLNGERLPLPESSGLTGSFTLDLDPAAASGATLSISRDGASPAWGGVISQSVRDFGKIPASGIDGLSVEKRFLLITTGADGEMASGSESFKVGDRLRVTLLIKSDRAMDYVALTDERPACLAPVEQTAGWHYIDGVRAYLEPRTGRSSFFISHLPKGNFVITYDCFVTAPGSYGAGIATLQSQYAPLLTAHSAGRRLTVK